MRPINLLPPEQAERASRRRGLAGLVLFVAIFIGLLAVASVFLLGRATQAEDELMAQQDRNAQLQRQLAELSEADALRTSYNDGVEQVTEALTVDVAWGQLLNDIGRVIPDRVWLTTVAATTQNPEDEETEPIEGSGPVYGSLTLGGVAFDYPDASTWIRTLDSNEWDAVAGAWVTTTTSSEVGGFTTVAFSSAASLTGEALSDRLGDRIPEVPQ